MGTTVSTVNGHPGVDGLEVNNVPTHLAALIEKLDSGSNLSRLTQAQIDALTSAQKPNGLTVFNTTRGVLQVSNGASFVDVLAGGVYQDWVPVIGSESGGAITQTPLSGECRYQRVGSRVFGVGAVTVTSWGSASGRIGFPLPVALPNGGISPPYGRVVGLSLWGVLLKSSRWSTPYAEVNALQGTVAGNGSPATLSWSFDYEAAV